LCWLRSPFHACGNARQQSSCFIKRTFRRELRGDLSYIKFVVRGIVGAPKKAALMKPMPPSDALASPNAPPCRSNSPTQSSARFCSLMPRGTTGEKAFGTGLAATFFTARTQSHNFYSMTVTTAAACTTSSSATELLCFGSGYREPPTDVHERKFGYWCVTPDRGATRQRCPCMAFVSPP
jgi:hypothetical protein